MFCSTIITTVGRPSLTRAVESILNQSFTEQEFELIVVNDSGKPLAAANWQGDRKVQVVDTWHRERSVARNTGAALARGRYLHFLDDDDWLLPDAFGRLYELAQSQDAAWVYGGTQLINRQGQPLIKIRPDINGNCFIQTIAGEWVPLQASFVRAEVFFAIGGFNPSLAGPEDNDLLRRVALNYSLAGIEEIVATVEWRGTASTTDYDRHPMQSRWAREQILNEAHGFARMRSSATSDYWHGRLVRAYLTSMVWNIQHGYILIGASRGCHTIASLLYSARYWLSPPYWRAVAKAYDSEAFRRGKEEAQASSSMQVSSQ